MLEKDSQHCSRAAQRFNFLDYGRRASETPDVHQLAPVRKLTLMMLRLADLAAFSPRDDVRGPGKLVSRARDCFEHPVRCQDVCSRGA
jgi:hypothetical protein